MKASKIPLNLEIDSLPVKILYEGLDTYESRKALIL